MRTLNISFSSEKDKKEFVKECENDFEKRLSDASERVIKSGKRNILLSFYILWFYIPRLSIN